MADPISRRDLDFLLYEWLDVEQFTKAQRYADHSKDTFDAVLDLAQDIAIKKYAPFNKLLDQNEPYVGDDGKVVLPDATADGVREFLAAGLIAGPFGEELDGGSLPSTVHQAAMTWFQAANPAMSSYTFLTVGNANLLAEYGTPEQIDTWVRPMLEGRYFGTMCLSEPGAGSSLSDITTKATPVGDGTYRVSGTKMWISAGDHELGENIVHLVLAKAPGGGPGVKGISLFIVPKFMVNADGSLGERNDVVLAGLNHKMGYRGTTNCLLNFGEGKFPVRGGPGAIGYLVGRPGEGLRCMFHMMNEARIGVGMAATMLGMAGYEAALAYARQRPQGRPMGPAGKDPAQPQVPIVQHADVKRMLLAQKAYAEGALALELYCARLVDEQHTGDAAAADDARLLLEVLTPIAKSWPSEWCLEANSLAIQIHGGYGYTRDFPVEQYWRDNRLNMIHEGTHGIQAADLLGRKVLMENGRGMQLLAARMQATMAQAVAVPELAAYAAQLGDALQQVGAATQAAWATGNPAEALANAVPYMQAFGHTVLAWVWLDVALATLRADATLSIAASAGRMGAARYFYHYELPKIGAWLNVVNSRDTTCAALSEAAF